MKAITVSKARTAMLSENGHYIILDSNKHQIYVHPSSAVAVPEHCLRAGLDTITYDDKKYACYESSTKFLRDCLHTAEEVMADKKFTLGDLHSKVVSTGTPFGVSDLKNIAAAKAVTENELADPKILQAYAIVATKKPASGTFYPYHVAAVVAVDDDERITLEVFASGTDARDDDRSAPGNFEIYSVSKASLSFHTIWKSSLSSPATIVLEELT